MKKEDKNSEEYSKSIQKIKSLMELREYHEAYYFARGFLGVFGGEDTELRKLMRICEAKGDLIKDKHNYEHKINKIVEYLKRKEFTKTLDMINDLEAYTRTLELEDLKRKCLQAMEEKEAQARKTRLLAIYGILAIVGFLIGNIFGILIAELYFIKECPAYDKLDTLTISVLIHETIIDTPEGISETESYPFEIKLSPYPKNTVPGFGDLEMKLNVRNSVSYHSLEPSKQGIDTIFLTLDQQDLPLEKWVQVVHRPTKIAVSKRYKVPVLDGPPLSITLNIKPILLQDSYFSKGFKIPAYHLEVSQTEIDQMLDTAKDWNIIIPNSIPKDSFYIIPANNDTCYFLNSQWIPKGMKPL